MSIEKVLVKKPCETYGGSRCYYCDYDGYRTAWVSIEELAKIIKKSIIK